MELYETRRFQKKIFLKIVLKRLIALQDVIPGEPAQ